MEISKNEKEPQIYDPFNGWMMPKPLPKRQRPMAFDEHFLPTTFQPYAVDIAERMQVPLDYLGIAMMIMAGAAIGRRVGIRPKQLDDWTVVPNLWGFIVGRPGFLKSPALNEILKPLKHLEAAGADQFQAALAEYEAKKAWSEANRTQMKERLKGVDGSSVAIQQILEDYSVELPVLKRYLINDTSPEKLTSILADNPNGVLLFRDELSGWYASLCKPGSEGARKFYLECWNGTGGYTVDRVGRGTIRIPHVCISMLGSIQPGALEAIMGGLYGGQDDDGLFQRFQLMIWPEVDPDFVNIDRTPDIEARKAVHDLILQVASLDLAQLGVEQDEDEGRNLPFLRFDEFAQSDFNAWRAGLEKKVRSGLEHPAFESHLAKYRSLLPSVALIYHVLEGKKGPVGGETLNRAMFFLDYLESHARRIYAPVIKPELDAVQNIARRLSLGKLEDGFTLRDVKRKGWSGLKDSYIVEQALKELVKSHWLEEYDEYKNGRPTIRYRINPNV